MMRKLICSAALAALAGMVCAQAPAPEDGKTQAAAAITVEKIATAAAVENREPVNESKTFDRTAGRVYTWTRIAATEVPVKTKHVYYADGEKISEVELGINAKSYRVWSYKTVWPGAWKVEVTDEAGTVLATAEFTVTKEAAAEPMKAEPVKAGTPKPEPAKPAAPAPEPPTQGK
jgi:hypothetical protein